MSCVATRFDTNVLLQELKIQEKVQKLNMGSIPRSMTAVIMDDLVDSCKVWVIFSCSFLQSDILKLAYASGRR